MGFHFVIILLIVITIVIIQYRIFLNTSKKIKDFSSIFPEKQDYTLKKDSLIKMVKSANDDDLKHMLDDYGYDSYNYYVVVNHGYGDAEELVFKREEAENDLINTISKTVEGIDSRHQNKTFVSIVESMNAYMVNNNSVNDYHLMKDIVDRNCDSKEDEINTQIPIPLYLGLVGTMAGIFVGVLFLLLNGGLSDLLNAGVESSNGAGIQALLEGVAMAMISSILGIILTTTASDRFKLAKTTFEDGKNKFFSWIQENLLPKLSDSMAGALRDMTSNLAEFNESFTNNVKGLDYALSKVNESYKQQTELMELVQKIADKDLSTKNLQLYNALTNSANQIETLGVYLKNSNEYLANVKALNDNIGMQERRTQIMENVGEFFKNESEQIEARRGMMSKTVAVIDDGLKQALDKIKENIDNEFAELQKTTLKNQDVIKQKTEEIKAIVDELHQLGDVKTGIDGLTKEMQEQNRRFEQLASSIDSLVEANRDNYEILKLRQVELKELTKKPKHSFWKRLFGFIGITVSSVVILAIVIIALIALYDSII